MVNETITVRRETLGLLCQWLLEAERRLDSSIGESNVKRSRPESRLALASCHEARGIISDLIAKGGDAR